MAIIGLQRRTAERGRIRIGVQATTKSGKRAPRKIDRFRFTSGDPTVIAAVAALYGGDARPWDNNGAAQHEVITDARDIPIVLPPGEMAFSQFYESWAKGFCIKRCDGARDSVRDCACDCDPDERDCKITTRLSVILPEVPGLGTWRLETHGYYAAVELAGALELIGAAAASGRLVPARLILTDREVRRLIDGQAEVRKFVVPMIDVDLVALAGATTAPTAGPAPVAGPQGALTAPTGGALGPGWRPVNQAALGEGPPVTVADQLAELDRPPTTKPRKNAAAPIKRTGRRPRTAAESNGARPAPDSDTGRCDQCGSEYGSEAVVKNPEPGGSKYIHKRCRDRAAADDGAQTEGSEADPDGGREGMASDANAGAAEPVPAPGSAPTLATKPATTRTMTHGQHAKVMALAAKAFPAWDGASSDEVDDYRRDAVLGLAAWCGQPGLSSRAEIDHATATPLIDALEALADCTLTWDGTTLRKPSGEAVAPPGEPDDGGLS